MAETYQRLTRTRLTQLFGVITRSNASLWLGSDHLLHVQQANFSETYKRFYFRDIQAITIWETPRRKVWNAVMIVPITICLMGLMFSAFPVTNIPAVIAWAAILLLLLPPLAINNLRGPACACELRTAVQTERLPSVCRLRQARKLLDQIRPLIVAAQGQLSADEVSARLRESVSGVASAPQAEPPPAAPPVIA